MQFISERTSGVNHNCNKKTEVKLKDKELFYIFNYSLMGTN